MPEGHELIALINGCVKAKRESQKEFYKRFYGFAIGITMRYCSNQEDAMEAVNDSFLKIFRHLNTFNPRHADYEGSLLGWMKSIILHTAIDHFRKYIRNKQSSSLPENYIEEKDIGESSIDKMSYKEILILVSRLSPVYKTVFNLFVIDGFKHEEIAEKLRISVGTSKSNLAKAKINIKRMLAESEYQCYERKAV